MIQFQKEDLENIGKMLCESFPEDNIVYYLGNCNLTMVFDGDESRVYIKTIAEDLILSYIVLQHSRKGIATKLLEILKIIGIERGFNRIVVESVLTPSMEAFCIKHNMILEDKNTFTKNYYINL